MGATQVRRGWWRAALAVVSVLLVEALAVGAHVLGGGVVAPQLSWLPVFAAPAMLCPLLAARRWTVPRLLVALGATQAVVHHWLAVRSTAPMGGMHMPGMPAAAHSHPADVRMLLAHVVGTLLTALLLAHAERVLAWVLTGLRIGVRPPASPFAAPARPAPVIVASDPRRLCVRLLLAGGLGRRGPPRHLVLPMT